MNPPRLHPEPRFDPSPQRFISRRVKQVVRRVEPWSVLKFSVVFYLSLMVVGFLASIMLFYAAQATGIIGNIENFVRGVGWPDFRIRPIQVFRAVLLFGVVQVIIWSALNLLVAFLYNLVSDVVGGVEVTMTEREL